jgi:FkbM family methyltransferase
VKSDVVKRVARAVLGRTLYRVGNVATIRFGPARGLRYRIFADYGIGPVFGRWEPAAQQWLVELLALGMVAYDIGANYGIHTLLLARRVGEQGSVFAFEPDANIRAALDEAVRINRFKNVDVVPYAVSENTGRASFQRGTHAGAGHLTTDDSACDSISVDTITLDDFVFGRKQPPPNLIKIDVEGAESSVLRGAEQVLAQFNPTLLIDLHTPWEDIAVGNVLSRHGYTAVRSETRELIPRLDRGWPAPDGVWGQIVARQG